MDTPPTKAKVLLVDDEINILRALKRVLYRDGYAIDLAEGGAEGIHKLEASEYAVIICDQKMPDISGAEVLTKSCELRPDTYRITLTGYTDFASAQRSINEGNIHRFMTKPWDETVLREVVRQGVASYEMILENRRLSALAEERRLELEQWNHALEAKVTERTKGIGARNRALAALRDQAEASLHDTVSLLVNLLDTADPDAAAHSRRVAELAIQIGEQLELEKGDLRTIKFAALLHEVGRLADLHHQRRGRARGPSGTKRAPVDEVSYAMLRQVRGFEKVADAIRCVPAPYAGGQKFSERKEHIPLPSRVIAVADVYDRAAVDAAKGADPRPTAGQDAVRAASGTRLDPRIVKVFSSETEEAPSIAVHEVELSPARLRPGMRLARDLANTLSMLMLSEGTVLDDALIGRIKKLAAEQMLARGVFVCCDEDTQASEDEPSPEDRVTPPLEPGQEAA